MKSLQLHPASLLAGFGTAALALVVMSQKPAPSAPKWEHQVVSDVSIEVAQRLANEGWEYVGYLGTGTLGASNDETLWRKPAK